MQQDHKGDKNAIRDQMIKRKKSLISQLKRTKSSINDVQDRQVARDSVQEQMKELAATAAIREEELKVLHERMTEFIRSKQVKWHLEQKQRALESQYQDLEALLVKMRKQVRLLGQEQQIKKGRTVVEYNTVVEIRDEQATQQKRTSVLTKHLQEVRRGEVALKNRLNSLHKEQGRFKKQKRGKGTEQQKIEELQSRLAKQITHLEDQVQRSTEHIGSLVDRRRQSVRIEEVNRAKKQLQQLQAGREQIKEAQGLNQRLMQENTALYERIDFLKKVDNESTSETEVFINQLHQKKALLQNQRDSLSASLVEQQAELNALVSQNPNLQSIKKGGKKKKQGKVKSSGRLQRKSSPVPESNEIIKPAKTGTYKWKGEKLKRLGSYLFVLLLGLGVIYSRLIYMP